MASQPRSSHRFTISSKSSPAVSRQKCRPLEEKTTELELFLAFNVTRDRICTRNANVSIAKLSGEKSRPNGHPRLDIQGQNRTPGGCWRASMFSPRRAAQFGLFSACMTLALCVTVLLAFGRTGDSPQQQPDSSPSGVLGQPSPEQSAQMASFVQAPPHQHN